MYSCNALLCQACAWESVATSRTDWHGQETGTHTVGGHRCLIPGGCVQSVKVSKGRSSYIQAYLHAYIHSVLSTTSNVQCTPWLVSDNTQVRHSTSECSSDQTHVIGRRLYCLSSSGCMFGELTSGYVLRFCQALTSANSMWMRLFHQTFLCNHQRCVQHETHHDMI